MAGTFTWRPDWGLSTDIEFKVQKAEFADYTQRSKKGINNGPPTITLSFSKRATQETDAIMDFLESKSGVESFAFIDRRGRPGLYTCEKVSITEDADFLASVQATFKRVYGG